uniref:Uncharacterized protein n=1 Tax=Mucochytrium quahogii TaxID=96639 RepID=A0A7S2RY52_9STRA|mmetsp:Transcript_21893/g.47740  ORF Transcript_21893/g.47740 Transcript_21893/m.47740 type:complete len:144 (+) Transcript_21893:1942-2373(+)
MQYTMKNGINCKSIIEKQNKQRQVWSLHTLWWTTAGITDSCMLKHLCGFTNACSVIPPVSLQVPRFTASTTAAHEFRGGKRQQSYERLQTLVQVPEITDDLIECIGQRDLHYHSACENTACAVVGVGSVGSQSMRCASITSQG